MDVKNHYFESAERYRCPVCMGNMREVDRVQEDGFFVRF